MWTAGLKYEYSEIPQLIENLQNALGITTIMDSV